MIWKIAKQKYHWHVNCLYELNIRGALQLDTANIIHVHDVPVCEFWNHVMDKISFEMAFDAVWTLIENV